MGRSYTYHVIGYAKIDDARDQMYPCMNRVEMAQNIHRADQKGQSIIKWAAQTKVGERILGLLDGEYFKRTSEIKLPRLPECPICGGRGCPVCNYAGICKKGNEKGWRDWQLAAMRKEYGTS